MAHLPASQDVSSPLVSPNNSKATPLVHVRQLSYSETDDELPKSASPFPKTLYRASDILANLWLGPALALLVLNLKGHIIGSSLGCHGATCHLDRFDFDLSTRTQDLDKRDHNILGALQVVAKVLDVWFTLVATSLAYSVTLYLASMGKGLPTDLLTKHLEYGELGFVKNAIAEYIVPLIPCCTSRTSPRRKHVGILSYVFIALLISLSVIANLMGPATAVLAIPTLQWIDREREKSLIFNEIASSTSPRDVGIFRDVCSNTSLVSGEFSCLDNLYGTSLDASVMNNQASNRQSSLPHGAILPSVFQELGVTCSVNLTETADSQWIPNRCVLRDLSEDFRLYANLSLLSSASFEAPGYRDYADLNSSLRARLQRRGPAVGVQTTCYNSTPTIVNISQDQSVRCYDNTPWMDGPNPAPSTKCIPWGSGWNVTQAHARFSIPDFRTASQEIENVSVEIFVTDRVAYIDKTTRPSCFVNGLIDLSGGCDWHEVFFDNRNPPGSMPQQTFEYYVPNKPNRFSWCDANYTLSFATYVLNPSSQNNLLNLVELQVSDTVDGHLEVHPDWILASWAVDRNGFVRKNRASGRALLESFIRTFSEPDQRALSIMDFYGAHLSSVSHAVSMISYTDIHPETSPGASTDEKRHPELRVWASGQLWKFGLESRTSNLGFVVVIAGTIVVLLRIYCYRWGVPLPLDLIVKAVRCRHGGEPDSVPYHPWTTTEFDFGQVGENFFYDSRREDYQYVRRRNWSSGTNTLVMDEVLEDASYGR
ncbi:hypothetical protein GJ744_002245 [Endocarpon pusillum]|uniref:Uncharacterized protein n=1 Tax=Endocarpon pusillum TaxID=364733 RepID=A0A8H7AC65_9EURO|nr:hypothetical protein GJ744_002245 [Endocarpon pusillum]